MDEIIIKQIAISDSYYEQVLDLRDEILRKPLGRSLRNEDLSKDQKADILVAIHNDKVIGCLLLHPAGTHRVQLRAMAVANEWQGKGVGKMLVQQAELTVIKNGNLTMILHARNVALGFYQKLGYQITSDEFTEVGIPHFMMGKIF